MTLAPARVHFGAVIVLQILAAATVLGNGAPPDRATAIAKAEVLIKDELTDPFSAVIEWPYGFAEGPLKWPLSRKRLGYFTCGRVNSRTTAGGYAGWAWFVVLTRDGAVELFTLDRPTGYPGAMEQCSTWEKAGSLKRI